MKLMLLIGLMALVAGLSGCASDGSDGAAGVAGTNGTAGMSAYDIAVANGFTGTEQEWLATDAAAQSFPVETCTLCHGAGKTADAANAHLTANSSTGSIAVSSIVVNDATADLVITFNVKINGANKTAYYDFIATDYRLTDNAGTMTRLDL